MARTATGSVGLMRAPKTSAHGSDSGWPSTPDANQTATPTIAVDRIVPATAKRATGPARSRKVPMSRPREPANSRKASMPLKTTAVKSIWRNAVVKAATTGDPGNATPTPATRSDASSPMRSRPTAFGRCTNRWLSQPNRAESTSKTAMRSNSESMCLVGRRSGRAAAAHCRWLAAHDTFEGRIATTQVGEVGK